MKYIFSILLCSMLLIKPAVAERETIFIGFEAKIVSILDEMTDEVHGGIICNFKSYIWMSIYGHDKFIIQIHKDNLLFAFDSQSLIRVGNNKPFPLKCNTKKNVLIPVSPSHAESVIKSLVKGETVKLRYYDWPNYNKYDEKLKNGNLSYVYDKAVKKFGWKDFGIPVKLAPVELDVHAQKVKEEFKGMGFVLVKGNASLGLRKVIDKHGGGCYITLNVKRLFGIQNGKWCCFEVDPNGKNRIIIRNPNDEIVFEGIVPQKEGRIEAGNPWPLGEMAAKAASTICI